MSDNEHQPYHTDKVVLIYTTFPSQEAAEGVAASLLADRLIACANIVGGMVAMYSWKGAAQRDRETVMILKTRASLVEAVTRRVRERHTYDNPAVVAFEAVGGSVDFLTWVLSETTQAGPSRAKQQ